MLTAEFKKGTGSERPFLAGLLPFGFSECRAAVGRSGTWAVHAAPQYDRVAQRAGAGQKLTFLHFS